MVISSDDARNAVDLDDRYGIDPDFVEYPRKSFRKDGREAAPEDFVYSSDLKNEWLDEAGLKRMLEA